MEENKPNPNDAIVSPYYPLTVYKDGTTFEWDGRLTDSLIVEDKESHDIAKLDGWVEAVEYPATKKAKPKG